MTTRVSGSEQRPRETKAGPIVVGVDPGGRSTSAVFWAAEEAKLSDRTLRLITAQPDEKNPAEESVRGNLAGLAGRLTLPGLEYRVEVGTAATVLGADAHSASLLVVGRRGLGSVHQLLAGRTSIAVASHSRVPVVVVPEQWLQPTMSAVPLVVGVESPDLAAGANIEEPDPDQAVLDFAFDRAARLRVPLIVVSGWAVPALQSWSPQDVAASRGRYQKALEARLQPWRSAYPDLEVAARAVAESPKQALLDAGRVAQMTVVGRNAGHRLARNTLGSTARAVLHHVRHPVAVVPGPSHQGNGTSPGSTWAPMF